MRYFILDVETSGFGESAGICDIAWVEVDEDLNEIETVTSLIDPEVPITPSAMGVHHITNEMVENEPTISEFFTIVRDGRIAGDVCLIGHRIEFDYGFVNPWFESITTQLCTLRLARRFFPDLADHKLQTIRYALGLEGDAHRAMGDVRTCLGFLRYLKDKTGYNLVDLIGIEKRPLFIKNMPFGKHRGEKLNDLPISYLRWLRDVAEIDADLRHSVLITIAEKANNDP